MKDNEIAILIMGIILYVLAIIYFRSNTFIFNQINDGIIIGLLIAIYFKLKKNNS